MNGREFCRGLLLANAKLDIDSLEFEANVQSLIGRLLGGELFLLDLVVCLKEHLTSGVEGTRAQGLNLLARVVKGVRSELTENEEVVLSGFFTSRLADWASLQSALLGCLTLLQGEGVCKPVVSSIANAFFEEVQVQDLKRSDRQLALEVFHSLIKDHGRFLGQNGTDLVQATISAIDGEKDPRCLLKAFACIPSLIEVYDQPGIDVGPLISGAEDLFDVISCYFPISFSHSTNDTHGIEKKDLAKALHEAMATTPYFAEHCIPLLLEKLSSSLRQAKLDALSCLSICCAAYGWECMAEHLSPIWSALKSDIVPKATMHGFDRIENPMQEQIGACLRKCIFSLNQDPDAAGGEGLDDMILSEPCINDFLTVFKEMSGIDRIVEVDHPLIEKVSWIIGMVASSGGTACIKTFKIAIEPLIHSALRPENQTDAFLNMFFGSIAGWLRSICASTHELDLKDPGIGVWLKQIHDIILDCFSRRPWTLLIQKARLELCLFPSDWSVLSNEQWLADVETVIFPALDAPTVAESKDQLQNLASEGIRRLLSGEFEEKTCQNFVHALVPQHGSFRFEASALDVLRSGCEVSNDFSEAVLGGFAGFLKGLAKQGGQQPKKPIDEAGLIRLFDFVSLELMDRLESIPVENSGSVGEAVVAVLSLPWQQGGGIPVPNSAMVSLGRVLNRLTAICALESSQREIASCTSQLLSRVVNVPDSSEDEWTLILPCCLVGLKIDILDGVQTDACLKQCSKYALSMSDIVSESFAPAVASLANKAPDASCWKTTVADVCENLLFPAIESDRSNRQAMRCLGWMLRGLVMRGASRELEASVLDRILDLVENCSMGESAAWEEGVVGEAVSIFGLVVMEDGVGEGGCFLDGKMRPRARRLWRQRSFSVCLSKMMSRLGRCSEEGKSSGALLLALGCLLNGAGADLVRHELENLFPKLLNVIDALSTRSKSKGVELQISSVSLLVEFSAQESFHSLFRDSFKDVLDALLKSCRWPHSVTVREKSLECLLALVKVSQEQCKNHRRKVVSILKDCVDDDKRRVRQKAAQCRRAWETI
ncbi:hypothetical protein BSKO_05396 [Bryopsis sp. KO-2023]|nr:hypothetical protein BSKO_05396 [Bryopsis sp. KO-2023]